MRGRLFGSIGGNLGTREHARTRGGGAAGVAWLRRRGALRGVGPRRRHYRSVRRPYASRVRGWRGAASSTGIREPPFLHWGLFARFGDDTAVHLVVAGFGFDAAGHA